jgi:hypothetical protein
VLPCQTNSLVSFSVRGTAIARPYFTLFFLIWKEG